MDKVGNVNNEVSIAGFWIYDLNHKNVIPLVKWLLDAICYFFQWWQYVCWFRIGVLLNKIFEPWNKIQVWNMVHNYCDERIYIYIYI